MTSLVNSTQMCIVRPSGHINASNASEFQDQLQQAILPNAPTTLVVDMSQVDSLDSAGLMALVKALAFAQSHDSTLILCCIPPSVQIILELTQLNRAFVISTSQPFVSRDLSQLAAA